MSKNSSALATDLQNENACLAFALFPQTLRRAVTIGQKILPRQFSLAVFRNQLPLGDSVAF